jgi:peptide/nickel transport system substrate-binding protein
MTRMRGLLGGPVALVAALALVLGAAGCGGGGGGGGGGTIIRGTTDVPVGLDPAGVYDLPSWDLLVNVYQTVLTIPPGGNKPVPDIAKSCDFSNPTTYKCTIKSGLKFSDGSPLTSEDVKYSFDRNVAIAAPEGASSLLADMKSVEAPDPTTVVFHLDKPNFAVWPYILTMQSMAVVPSSVFPKDKLQPDNKVIGSGQYTVASYEPGQQAVFEKNSKYSGAYPAKNDRAIIQYFDKPSALKLAVEQGDVDVGYRSFSPTDLEDLKGASGLSVVGGSGTEIRYLVFNLRLQPGDNDAQKLAIRRAVAYTIDRQAVAQNVYDGTVKPLYSMVPQGLEFATQPFKDEYGAGPDLNKAKQELQQAGVKTPVDLEVWYTPSHYGTGSADEYAEIKHQLDDSGLFKVTLKSTEWTQYDEAALTNKYPQFQFGWFPDYPDADDYTAPFYGTDTGFLNNDYSNPTLDKQLAAEEATTDKATRAKAFAEVQKIGAQDVPVIPIWQGGQVAAVRDGVHGVEDTFDAAYLFRLWVISKD